MSWDHQLYDLRGIRASASTWCLGPSPDRHLIDRAVSQDSFGLGRGDLQTDSLLVSGAASLPGGCLT